jgi:hypothetical protein
MSTDRKVATEYEIRSILQKTLPFGFLLLDLYFLVQNCGLLSVPKLCSSHDEVEG